MFTFPTLGAGLLLSLATAAPLSPEDAVSMAFSNHPRIQAAQADLLLAQTTRDRAGAPLYSPAVGLQSTLDGQRLSADLSMPISLTGARRWRHRQSVAALEIAEASLTRAHLEVASAVRAAYIDAAVGASVARLAASGVDLSQQLKDAAQLRYTEGEASLLDLRLARLSGARAASWLMAARLAEGEALRTLSASVGQPVSSDDLVADPLQVVPEPGSLKAGSRTDVLAAASALEAAESALRFQRAQTLAPLSVGVSIEQEDGDTFFGPAVSMTLPLFERNQTGRAQATGDVARAQARLTETTARAASELDTTTDLFNEATALLSALGGDLPEEARQALEGITFSYQAGHADLLSTILLQAEVLEGQVALIELRGQLADARLALLLAREDAVLLGGER